MDFLRDPLVQFLLSTSIALASLFFAAASYLLTRQMLPKQSRPQTPKPLRTKLPRKRTLQGCTISFLAITASLFGLLYCLVQILNALSNPSPLSIALIAILALVGLGCVFLIFTNTLRSIRGEPQMLMPEQEEAQTLTNQ